MKKRADIIFKGAVQGVGFRFTAENIANVIGLTGWVRNRPDGAVEVLCEGREEDINALISRIEKEMGHYIHSVKTDWKNATGEFKTFEITF